VSGAYVYVQSETEAQTGSTGLFTVGFYDPRGTWHPESDHHSITDAAARVSYLNGDNVRELIAVLRAVLSGQLGSRAKAYVLINKVEKL
jgi:hypothetical protein